MKTIVRSITLAVALVLATGQVALAADKFLGTVVKIDLSGDKAVATLKSEDGKTIDLLVDDQVTLEKFKDGRISAGDLIKAKYDAEGGKNHVTYFKKPGGC
jgi:hypothetical protein